MELKFMTEPALNPALMSCPHCGEKERIWIHSQQERRYRCATCRRTFAETRGTPLFGTHYPAWVVILVVTLLAARGPVQAIVFAFSIDERTVAAWQRKAGQHAQRVQAEVVCNGRLDLGQVQADELYVRTQWGAAWMATAVCVFSRLFLWGAVSIERSTNLVEKVVVRVHAAACRGARASILWVTDGYGGWAQAIRKVFRDPLYTGRPGRPRLLVWPELHLVQVVKRYTSRRLTAIERRLVIGDWRAAQDVLLLTQLFVGTFNTAYIERLNATLRTWIPALTRRPRTPARYRLHLQAAMFWTGCVYNFCRVHNTLAGTPAMAAGLTESVWSVRDLLFCFRVKRESLHVVL
jgi:transposase-like protein